MADSQIAAVWLKTAMDKVILYWFLIGYGNAQVVESDDSPSLKKICFVVGMDGIAMPDIKMMKIFIILNWMGLKIIMLMVI